MNKYKLNVSDIREKIRDYELLYYNIHFDDMTDREMDIISVLNDYQFLLENFDIKRQFVTDDSDSRFSGSDEEIIDDCFFKGINNSNSRIDESIMSFYKMFQARESDEMLIIDQIHIDNDRLLELTDEIVRSTSNKKFISYYDKAKNRTATHIQYYDGCNYPVSGLCFNNPIDLSFCNFLIRENSLMDIVTATHETFHSIIYYYLAAICSVDYAYTSPYINEVEGYLANLIVADYLNSLATFELVDNLQECIIQDIIAFSRRLFIGNVAAKNLNSKGNIRIGKTNEQLIRNGVSKKITKINKYDYIAEPYIDLASKSCSFMTACDLFELYKSDKEKAIHNLLKISELNPDNVTDGLRKFGVTFMDDGFLNFRKLSDKVLEKKKG